MTLTDQKLDKLISIATLQKIQEASQKETKVYEHQFADFRSTVLPPILKLN